MTSISQAAQRLEAAGVPSAAHDARALADHAQRHGLSYEELIEARARRVPLQHLTGSVGFRYLDLLVGPGVFVPRPESELLIEAVLTALTDVEAPIVVDLCAGSGAIGLSVAQECPRAVVHLVERSPAAYDWLGRNVDHLEPSTSARVRAHCADLNDAPDGLDGQVDVVVSNPPYVADHERDLVDPEVRDHDPAEALWAGDDGMDVIRGVMRRALLLLRPYGLLVMEHSDRQQPRVLNLLRDNGFHDVSGHRDLTGRPRFVTAMTPC